MPSITRPGFVAALLYGSHPAAERAAGLSKLFRSLRRRNEFDHRDVAFIDQGQSDERAFIIL